MINEKQTLKDVKPYATPKYAKLWDLKLDSNENPYGASKEVLWALKELTNAQISRYPHYGELIDKVAQRFRVSQDEVLLTNGADEALSAAINTYISENDRVLSVTPSFSMPKIYTKIAGAHYIEIPYSDKWTYPAEAVISTIDDSVKAVIITTPNNPTADIVPENVIKEIVQKCRNIPVIIDETYANFSGVTNIRLVEEIKPRAFVIENVPGLLSLFNGQIKTNIVKRLTNLGYHVNYDIMCAADYGVPQMRRRVVFVGLKGRNFEFPVGGQTQITCSMALDDLPPLEDSLGSEIQQYSKPCTCEYQKLMRKNSQSVKNHVAAAHSEKVKRIIALVPDGGNYKDLPEIYRESRNFHVAWTRFNSQKPAPTIDTGHRHHFHYRYNRVPTVRECARLQSFPDDFVFLGNKTQQFRQVGNAVPPLMAQAIAEKLKEYLSGEEE